MGLILVMMDKLCLLRLVRRVVELDALLMLSGVVSLGSCTLQSTFPINSFLFGHYFLGPATTFRGRSRHCHA
ncbi:hypothetical protein DER44DRAFT_800706 [Fusarium oxysporum]|nr:hypothetical protein DER44DRAFT_800706 [Fusarium oxysporum]